jgi:hypothetical protein
MTINDNYRKNIENSFFQPVKPDNEKTAEVGSRKYFQQKNEAITINNILGKEINKLLQSKTATSVELEELRKYESALAESMAGGDYARVSIINQQFKAKYEAEQLKKKDTFFEKSAEQKLDELRAAQAAKK